MTGKATILVVEDDAIVRKATRKALESAGYQTLEATNGEEALQLVYSVHPDLVLLDVNMPVMDGLTALQRIKSDPELVSVFVVIVSGSRIEAEDRIQGLETGADGYLVRPISNRELLAHVQAMLRIRAAETLARQREQQLRRLIVSNVDGVLVVDRDGYILFANPSACEMLNRSSEDIRGQELGIPITAGEHAEIELLRPNNQLRTVELRVAEIEWEEQPVLLASLRDITERKKAEEQVRRLNAELEARVEERTRQLKETQEQLIRHEKLALLGQLAGSVGHELRSPLNIISNAVYFLNTIQPQADEKTKEYLQLITSETTRAGKIINDLLDFARVKPAERQAISVAELMRRVFERYPAPENIHLTLDLRPDLPPLWVDARQMEQVLGNLVLNAYEAMPSGGQLSVISKKLSVTEHSLITDHCSLITDACLLITVRDSGPGIPPENLPKIFEPLFTTKPKGFGLGLPICKMLTETNGGKIWVDSQPGQGATFHIQLPIHPSDAEAA